MHTPAPNWGVPPQTLPSNCLPPSHTPTWGVPPQLPHVYCLQRIRCSHTPNWGVPPQTPPSEDTSPLASCILQLPTGASPPRPCLLIAFPPHTPLPGVFLPSSPMCIAFKEFAALTPLTGAFPPRPPLLKTHHPWPHACSGS